MYHTCHARWHLRAEAITSYAQLWRAWVVDMLIWSRLATNLSPPYRHAFEIMCLRTRRTGKNTEIWNVVFNPLPPDVTPPNHPTPNETISACHPLMPLSYFLSKQLLSKLTMHCSTWARVESSLRFSNSSFLEFAPSLRESRDFRVLQSTSQAQVRVATR